MLHINGKEFAQGMSRKQIEDRGGKELLVKSTESLVPQSVKKASGFSLADRAIFKGVK